MIKPYFGGALFFMEAAPEQPQIGILQRKKHKQTITYTDAKV